MLASVYTLINSYLGLFQGDIDMRKRLLSTILFGGFLLSSVASTASVSAKTTESGRVKDGGVTAAVVITAAVAWAEENGLLEFAFHAGPDECRSFRRFNNTRTVLERAKSGQDAALRELSRFINASSMQRKLC